LQVMVSPQPGGGPGYSLGHNVSDQTIDGLLPDGIYRLKAFSFDGGAPAGSLNFSVHGAAVKGPVMSMTPSVPISVNVHEEFTSRAMTTSMSWTVHVLMSTVRAPTDDLSGSLEPVDHR